MNRSRRRFMKWFAVSACVLTFLLLLFASGQKRLPPPAGSRLKAWKEYAGDPVIPFGQNVKNTVWNDPSVLKEENGTYRMWLSGGDASDLKHIVVRAYSGRSDDGIHWDIDPKPCLSPSTDSKAWDSLRIETPSVIKVAETYHMYYTGFDEAAARSGVSSIGHATSQDGIKWTKDPANPVITYQTNDKFRWAYRGAGEPGAVYNRKDGLIYLYYVGMRFSSRNPTLGHVGILLATAKDGSRFSPYGGGDPERMMVLMRDVPNAIDGAWFGYTNPAPLVTPEGEFHMFCTFLVIPKGPASARHVTIEHAVSDDGVHFHVAEENIFEAAKGDWKDQQVRSPTVILDEGRFKMWFAGETQKPYYASGIGYAYRDR